MQTGKGLRPSLHLCTHMPYSTLLRNGKEPSLSCPPLLGGIRVTSRRASMGGTRTFSWASVPCQSPGTLLCPANPVCSLSSGFGGRRGTEWNRNSMWGASPLILTKPAFLFLLLSCFSSLPAKLLISFCSFLLCRLMFQINAGGVLCRAGGSPACLCLPRPAQLPLWVSD